MRKPLFALLTTLLTVNLLWASSRIEVEFGHFDFAGGPLCREANALQPLLDGNACDVMAITAEASGAVRVASLALNGDRLFGSAGYFLLDGIEIDPALNARGLFLRIWNAENTEAATACWDSPVRPLLSPRQQISFATGEWIFHEVDRGPQSSETSSADVYSFALRSNYPNPFNAETRIGFEVPSAARVTLRLYDLLGREAAVISDNRFAAGPHVIQFNAASLASGNYLLRMETDAGFSAVRRITLLK